MQTLVFTNKSTISFIYTRNKTKIVWGATSQSLLSIGRLKRDFSVVNQLKQRAYETAYVAVVSLSAVVFCVPEVKPVACQ